MSAGETSKELAALLKTLRAQFADELATPQSATCCSFDPGEPVLGCFLKSFLLWESTSVKASQALKRLETAIVDLNELRACMPDEVVRIGPVPLPAGMAWYLLHSDTFKSTL